MVRKDGKSMVRQIQRYTAIGILLPVVLLSFFSMAAISSILNNKLQNNIRNNLKNMQTLVDERLDELSIMAENVLYDVQQNGALYNLLFSESYFTRSQYKRSIFDSLNAKVMSNPSLAIIACIDIGVGSTIVSTTYLTGDTIDGMLGSLEPMATKGFIAFYKPHASTLGGNEYVLSVSTDMRVGTVKDGVSVRIYIESNDSVLQLFNRSNNDEQGFYYLLIDGAKEKMLFGREMSPDPLAFASEGGKYGISVAYAIARGDYDRERAIYLTFAACVLLAAILLCFWIRHIMTKLFTKPINNILSGINHLSDVTQDEQEYVLQNVGVIEMDEVIDHINDTNAVLRRLIADLQSENERKRTLEVNMLRYQISPHFLYNSLNAIQWMARLKSDKEIDDYTTQFISLLRYNLDKSKIRPTIRDELEAAKCYIELQKVRYGEKLQADFEIDPHTLDWHVPKFILQPLVENSIYHGFVDGDGTTTIRTRLNEKGFLIIEVEDNGCGFRNGQENVTFNMRNKGMGIGINYVHQVLLETFGNKFDVQVGDSENGGALVIITIQEKTLNAQSTDC